MLGFNVFAAELFNSIKVRKTQSAEIEEGSLGATVDLRGSLTARPTLRQLGLELFGTWALIVSATSLHTYMLQSCILAIQSCPILGHPIGPVPPSLSLLRLDHRVSR